MRGTASSISAAESRRLPRRQHVLMKLLAAAIVIAGCVPANAQWRWRDDGTPERIGPPASRGAWQRNPGYQTWEQPAPAWQAPPYYSSSPYGAQPYAAPPYGAPPQALSNEVRDGGARPAIDPVAPPVVAFPYSYPANSIVIDSEGRRLYFVLPGRTAFAYEISVGREGFNWTGTEIVSRKQAWPDWHPPAEMRERDPRLPVKMTGGLKNPLGAMALYLGTTLYRIHGTDAESTVGQAASSGCFRMRNAEVLHLASLADVGTTVHVVQTLGAARLSGLPRTQARAVEPAPVPRAGPAPRVRRDPWYDWDRAPAYRNGWPNGGGWRW